MEIRVKVNNQKFFVKDGKITKEGSKTVSKEEKEVVKKIIKKYEV